MRASRPTRPQNPRAVAGTAAQIDDARRRLHGDRAPRGRQTDAFARRQSAEPHEPRASASGRTRWRHRAAAGPPRRGRPLRRRRRTTRGALGSAPLRTATTLTSSTHSPPRTSPPAPPSACATGSTDCHTIRACVGSVLAECDDGGHPVVEDHPARDQRDRPQQADGGGDAHRGGGSEPAACRGARTPARRARSRRTRR